MLFKNSKISIISLIFFVSGCAALIFETAWFRVASIVLGSSIYSAAAVLMAFMLGLGIGNAFVAWYGRKIRRTVLFYVCIELLIGLSGVLSVFLLPLMSPMIANLVLDYGQDRTALTALRFTLAFLVFMVPAVAMGATLPVLQKIIYPYEKSFGRSFARLYGWNTVGAVVGVLLAEFVFIQYIGIINTALMACVLNFIAAYILIKSGLPKTSETNLVTENQQYAIPTVYKIYLVVPFLTGFTLLALEVVWFRYSLLFINGTSIAFAIMLSVILVGIGVGGLITTKITRFKYNLDTLILVLLLFAGIYVTLGYYIYNNIAENYYSLLGGNLIVFVLSSLVLMLPVSIITGMLFPLLGEKFFQSAPETTRASGIVTLMNTVGAGIGSAVATFVFLPYLGIEDSIFTLSILYCLTGFFFVILFIKITSHIYKFILPVVTAIILFLAFPIGDINNTYQTFARTFFRDYELVKVHEGLNETLQYYRKSKFGKTLNYRLITNNFSMSGTDYKAKRYMKMYAYFPYIFNQNIEDALQISYGVGSTAEAITRLPSLKNFDVVDISEEIIQNSKVIHDFTGYYPLDDDRATMHIEDGRFYLQTTNKQYDLITGEPPPPKMAGVVNLYTEEYFRLIRSKLKLNGIVSYWLPMHSLSETDAIQIIKAFCNAFDDCSLWNGIGLEFMLIGSNGGLQPISEEKFEQVWHSDFANELFKIGLESPSQLVSMFLADTKSLDDLTKNYKPVTDNYPHRISPSYSDINYQSNINLYLLDQNRRVSEIKNSELIKKIFPGVLIEQAVNESYLETMLAWTYYYDNRYVDLNFWKSLHSIIMETGLTELPLLALRSTPDEREIIESIEPIDNFEYRFTKAKVALAKRDYKLALSALQKCAEHSRPKNQEEFFYKLYLYVLAINNELTKEQYSNIVDAEFIAKQKAYINWLESTFIVN